MVSSKGTKNVQYIIGKMALWIHGWARRTSPLLKIVFALKFWAINFKATTTKSYTLFSEKVMNSKHCKMNKIVFVISIKV